MDFFKQIIEMSPRPNLTIEIEGSEDGQLSVSVLPVKKAGILPVLVKGTAEEMDEGFFEAIRQPFEKVAGLLVSKEDFEKSVESAAKAEPAKPEAPAAKKEETKAAPSKRGGRKAETKSSRKCRVCGCTEDDCSQCIEASGEPCTWVEYDLCSRCKNEQQQNAPANGFDVAAAIEGAATLPELHRIKEQHAFKITGSDSLTELFLARKNELLGMAKPAPAPASNVRPLPPMPPMPPMPPKPAVTAESIQSEIEAATTLDAATALGVKYDKEITASEWLKRVYDTKLAELSGEAVPA